MQSLLSINNFFLLAIFCLPLYLVHLDIFGLPTNVFEIIVAVSVVYWIAREKFFSKKKLPALPKTLWLSILLILIGTIFSILCNNNYRAGFGILKSWFLLPIIFSYALYAETKSAEFIEKIFLTIFLSVSLVGFLAIIYKILGVVTYDNRLTAFYLSPNQLAMYLAPGLFFGSYFLAKNFLLEKYSQKFFACVILFLLMLVPFYFTYSYGAWLAVLVAMLIIAIGLFPHKKSFLLGFFIICLTIMVFFQTDTQKFSSLTHFSARSSFASRMMVWQSALLIIKQNPFFGIGPGNFQARYLENQQYFPLYLEWAVPQPHNIFLAFWTQTGLLGFIGFIFLLFFVFQKSIFLFKKQKTALLIAPLLGFFIYTVLHGLIDTTYWKNDLAFLFWICVFLILSIKLLESKNRPSL
jgi:putative inorganic carbon (hco3(-)) transporter